MTQTPICFVALHEEIELLFCQYHLHQVGLNALCIGQEIDVLPVNGIKADEAHVKLAHAGVVIVQLRDDDFVDELEVD